ncbi:hypothetical protein AN7039.2 [Aspergillus nidulans FGSC A4]|uniref:Uncharacterized protein n=1 Tax=Emericella nidulans (strain FGSC A4 / ATCC 38163 / CBS 112.46 / NRRL 194 / M139) TaxID=227321 RepID=Q5AXE1_EMENI|nr:hypothetical protein [Aspergillus nidulans FGSC A4]EAA61685.1 hypothetical protein AN7039.2 [Aspergillus nidulans FGSC A4]CBF79206.1 TPA: conserved hypothetical protein [Aspergillus nidulans FGSC A4]|eukprot:XP_664643.1 hypothetical protein AN7039.2 [Aspergillus nidulans FGSC A4]
MDRPGSRPLSPVLEEKKRDRDPKVRKGLRESNQIETKLGPESDTDTNADDDDDDTLPLEIDVHGLRAKVYLNCADVDIVPARYLEKADRSPILKRTPWIFRTAKDGRCVNIAKWSKVDIRYRGVFKTLKKVPMFSGGLFGGSTCRISSAADEHEEVSTGWRTSTDSRSGWGSGSCSASSKSSSSKVDFEEAVKAQGQAIYALLDEVLSMLGIKREAESHREMFFLRPRLVSCQPEYWTGYRVKHRDSPLTAGSVSLDYEPSRGMPRAVMPVTTTSEPVVSLKRTLEGEFKLLLSQLLINVHRLSPPGDKIPDQEAFLIGLHGSKLHILRGIFPGQKTSKLWSGRHNPREVQSTNRLFRRRGGGSGNGPEGQDGRFYSKTNLERFMEQVEWNQLSNPDNEVHPRSFQVLGSCEYDLWLKCDFGAAMKMLAGLIMYLMSGQARCGVLQDVFERYPYDEETEPESDVGGDAAGMEKAAQKQKEIEEEEERLRKREREKKEEEKARLTEFEAIKGSMKDKIGGLTEGLRQPWCDWVWEDKGCDTGERDGEEALIVGGPY